MRSASRLAQQATLVAVAALAAAVMTAGPAAAGTAAPPTGADGGQAPAGAAEPQRLSPAALAAQVAAADRLRAQLLESSAGASAATTRIERLSAQSNLVLTQLAAARAAERAAGTEALLQWRRFESLSQQLRTDQTSVGRWAHDLYVNGGPLADYMSFLQVLGTQHPDQAAEPLAILHYVADARGRALDRLEGLTAAQRDAAANAESASRRAITQAATVAATKARLDTLLRQQRAALATFRQAQAHQLGAAGSLRGSLLRSGDPRALAADQRLTDALRLLDAPLVTDTGPPCTGDLGSYPNGRLPASALCPLYAAAGQSLRPDAARAFNAMSRAYEKDTGSPLCVSDAYRSYAEQVMVSITRAAWAARPGTSNHGLGLAVDLCGGVNSFGTTAHFWMDAHAPLYGWFHPAWAEPDGALPEPWHWEFAG
jgi:zinc D-Ala-D-Ala carboxypeptidase